jgi:type I restriction enzyme S subunit
MGEPVGIRPKFAFYWFLGNREQLVSLSYGGGQPNISGEIVRQVRLSVPPIEEQEQIVRFLDRETAKFDALIAKKQRLIELLQEKRTALISHAVTQGLDPGGPKKESGIEWLGKIPSHWTVHRIATIASKITNGYVGPTRDIFVPEGTRYLQSLHIKSGSILFERGPYYVTDSWSKRHPKSILRVGDVLIVQTGAEVGQCAVVGQEYAGSNCHALIIISPKPHYIIGGFLGAVIRSSYGRSLLEHVQTGALHPHLNCTHVRTLPIPCPPLADQGLILKDLEIRSARLDALLRTVEAGIERVWEYRTALISAAVTGKIDVRGEVE